MFTLVWLTVLFSCVSHVCKKTKVMQNQYNFKILELKKKSAA
jgi:hypothetical protein